MTKKNLVLIFVALYPILPGYFKIAGLDSGVVLAIIFSVFYSMFILMDNGMIKNVKSRMGALLVCGVLITIPLLFHGEISTVVRTIIEYVVVPFFIIDSINDKNDIHNIVDILLKVCFILSICGIVECILGKSFFGFLFNGTAADLKPVLQIRGNFVRIATTFGHSISYAIYLSFCVLTSFYLYCRSKDRKYLVYYVLIFINIILTLARFPIIVFIVAQLLMLWKEGYVNFLKVLSKIVLLVIIGIVIISLVFPAFLNTLESVLLIIGAIFSPEAALRVGDISNANPFTYRLELLNVIPQYVKEHFWIGSGNNLNFKFNMLGHTYFSIDNAYLGWILKYGIIGLIGNVGFICLGFPRKYKDKQKNSEQNRTRTLCFILILVYLINLLSVAQMYEYKVVIVIISVILALPKTSQVSR